MLHPNTTAAVTRHLAAALMGNSSRLDTLDPFHHFHKAALGLILPGSTGADTPRFSRPRNSTKVRK